MALASVKAIFLRQRKDKRKYKILHGNDSHVR